MGKLVYVVDDDTHIRNLLLSFLRKEGLTAEGYINGTEMFTAIDQHTPDIVILDADLQGNSGLSICTSLREKSKVPIILISSNASEIDRITGITLGADDYIVKPFSPIEVVVRAKALMRRVDMDRSMSGGIQQQNPYLAYGDIVVDVGRRKVQLNDKDELRLTPMEYDFFIYLLINRNRAISRNELLRELWHFEIAVETRATDDLVKRLRRKLSDQHSCVQIDTVWGIGYRINSKCSS